MGRAGGCEARGQRHPVHRLPRQRRPLRTSTRSSRSSKTSRSARATSSTCPRGTSSPPAAGRTSTPWTPARRRRARAQGAHHGHRRAGDRARPSASCSACTRRRTTRSSTWPRRSTGRRSPSRVRTRRTSGSTAVKEVIEEVQPILSLHGHIHESRAAVRIGRTLAVNPGSSYVEGMVAGLRGRPRWQEQAEALQADVWVRASSQRRATGRAFWRRRANERQRD